MKKFLQKTGITAAAATTLLALSMGAVPALAAETPAVTLNNEPTSIRTTMKDGEIYFSLRDYWVNVSFMKPEKIVWYNENKVVSNGYHFLDVDDQKCRDGQTGEFVPLTTPVLLQDGVTYVTTDYLDTYDKINSKYIQHETEGNTLHFKKLIWEQSNIPDLKYHWHVVPIGIHTETGLPDLEPKIEAYRKYYPDIDFSPETYSVEKTTAENGDIVFTYTNKTDPSKTLTVTMRDGFTIHVMDDNALNLYRPR